MRVLQLIDSLQGGGTERVAVNIANALSDNIDASFLCSTRKEGLLKKSIKTNVAYLFLNKTKTIDLKAILRLHRYVRQQNIGLIHAHSTSFFLATIIKLLNRNMKLVWHDHYGNSEYLDVRKNKMLRMCSRYFSHIFSVNKKLEVWARQSLKTDGVSYLPNFAVQDKTTPITTLKGENRKRILHLANLRPQKDHFTLLRAFEIVQQHNPNWTLHCIGKDFNDEYSNTIKKQVNELKLNDKVFLYGSKADIRHILSQSDIGVLSSRSEGLPIALLEYGLAGIPVVVTDVGDCKDVVINNVNGFVVTKENPEELAKGILQLLENKERANAFGQQLKLRIHEKYSETKYIENLLGQYSTI